MSGIHTEHASQTTDDECGKRRIGLGLTVLFGAVLLEPKNARKNASSWNQGISSDVFNTVFTKAFFEFGDLRLFAAVAVEDGVLLRIVVRVQRNKRRKNNADGHSFQGGRGFGMLRGDFRHDGDDGLPELLRVDFRAFVIRIEVVQRMAGGRDDFASL